jgi:hypothetical protein
MTKELNDRGQHIEIPHPLHSKEWCEMVWPELMYEMRMKFMTHVSPMICKSAAIDLIKHRIDPNSEQFNGIMAGCSEEFREAVRSKMNED